MAPIAKPDPGFNGALAMRGMDAHNSGRQSCVAAPEGQCYPAARPRARAERFILTRAASTTGERP